MASSLLFIKYTVGVLSVLSLSLLILRFGTARNATRTDHFHLSTTIQFLAAGQQFILTSSTTSFGITSIEADYFSFVARLSSAENVHFACFMNCKLPTVSTLRYREKKMVIKREFDCPNVELLDAGMYDVQILLVTHPVLNASSECFDNTDDERCSPDILEYVYRKNFTTYADYRECLDYPMQY